jgi:hypothetical protein
VLIELERMRSREDSDQQLWSSSLKAGKRAEKPKARRIRGANSPADY